jgi:hypothetical protein
MSDDISDQWPSADNAVAIGSNTTDEIWGGALYDQY